MLIMWQDCHHNEELQLHSFQSQSCSHPTWLLCSFVDQTLNKAPAAAVLNFIDILQAVLSWTAFLENTWWITPRFDAWKLGCGAATSEEDGRRPPTEGHPTGELCNPALRGTADVLVPRKLLLGLRQTFSGILNVKRCWPGYSRMNGGILCPGTCHVTGGL